MIDYAALGAAVIGGIVWSLRLEGRVNNHDTILAEREKQTTDFQSEIKDALSEIRQKLDYLVGFRPRP